MEILGDISKTGERACVGVGELCYRLRKVTGNASGWRSWGISRRPEKGLALVSENFVTDSEKSLETHQDGDLGGYLEDRRKGLRWCRRTLLPTQKSHWKRIRMEILGDISKTGERACVGVGELCYRL